MTDITEIKRKLVDRAQPVAEHLLPRGVLHGKDWCVGSIHGEPAESLKVCVRGHKAGDWADFAATGESGDHALPHEQPALFQQRALSRTDPTHARPG